MIGGWPAAARAVDPLNIMRAFCQADGRGDRLDPRTWPRIAGLIGWSLEPAWDHVFLIRGFELGTPQRRDGAVEIEVRYTVLSNVRSNVVEDAPRVETHVYRLAPIESGGWTIQPPAPPPYIFENMADAPVLAGLLDPGSGDYVSDSAFVWRMLRDAGWPLDYADVATLASSDAFTTERTAQVGDVAIYYDRDQPYHVGIVESDEAMVSATLNGGIRRTPFGAFAGEVRYRRPIATSPALTWDEPTPTLPPAPPKRHPKRRPR